MFWTCSVVRFKTEEEAIAVGNDTSSGLAGKFLILLCTRVPAVVVGVLAVVTQAPSTQVTVL